MIFDMDECPILNKVNPKRTQQGEFKPKDIPQTTAPPISTLTAKEIRDQILSDMKSDITKLVSTKINSIHMEMTTQLFSLKNTLQQDTKNQIAEVLQTIHALNQQFTEVMDCLPTNQPQAPAHKKSKGLGKAK